MPGSLLGERGPKLPPMSCPKHLLHLMPGSVVTTYRKTHLCDVEVPGQGPMRESSSTLPGPRLEPPVSTPAGKVGL